MSEKVKGSNWIFADDWFDSYRVQWLARPALRNVRIGIRKYLWTAWKKAPETARLVKRKTGKLVPSLLKRIVKKGFRMIGNVRRRNGVVSGPDRGRAGQRNGAGNDSGEEVTLTRAEYRDLTDELRYWREQAGHLVDEIEYLKSRDRKADD